MINLFNKNLDGFSEAVVDGNVEIKNNRLVAIVKFKYIWRC